MNKQQFRASNARTQKWHYEKDELIRNWAKKTGRPEKEWFDAYSADGMPLGCGSDAKHRAVVRHWFATQ